MVRLPGGRSAAGSSELGRLPIECAAAPKQQFFAEAHAQNFWELRVVSSHQLLYPEPWVAQNSWELKVVSSHQLLYQAVAT